MRFYSTFFFFFFKKNTSSHLYPQHCTKPKIAKQTGTQRNGKREKCYIFSFCYCSECQHQFYIIIIFKCTLHCTILIILRYKIFSTSYSHGVKHIQWNIIHVSQPSISFTICFYQYFVYSSRVCMYRSLFIYSLSFGTNANISYILLCTFLFSHR